MTKPEDDRIEKFGKRKVVDTAESQRRELAQQIDALNNSAIVSETDAEGNITFINDMFCQISGYAREELMGKNHRMLKSGLQPNGLFVGMWKAISLGNVWKGELMNKKKNGDFYWVDTTIVPFKNAEGKIYKYVGIRFDITNQKAQQELLYKQSEELQIQQERLVEANGEIQAVGIALEKANRLLERKAAKAQISYQELYESLRQDVFLISLDGTVVNINRKGILNCGVDANEILNNHYSKSPFLKKILGAEDNNIFDKYFNENVGKNEIVEFSGENLKEELFYGEADVCLSLFHGKFHLQVAISDITDKKKSELAQAASEERFELAMNGANDGLWDWNLLNDEVYYSPRWKGILGFEENELQSSFKTFDKFLHEDDKENVQLHLNDYLNGKIPEYALEFRMKHKLGHYVNILSRGQGVRDASGKFVRMVGTNLDITERLKRIEAIKKSELRLNKAQRIAKIGDWERDLATGDVSWSDEMYTIYNCDPKTFKPNVESIVQLIHPEDKKLFTTWVAATISGNRMAAMDYRIIDAQDKIKFIRAGGEIIFDESGKPILAYGTAQDITELKKAEEELQRLSSILQVTSDFVGISSSDRKVVYLNKAGRLALGYGETEDLSQTKISDYLPDWSNELIAKVARPYAIQNGKWTGETAWINKEGIEIPVSQVIIAHKNSKGELEYMSTISRDITAQKAAELKLKKSEYMLSHAQRIAKIGSWEFDLISLKHNWSSEMFRIYNCDPETFIPTSDSIVNLLLPEDRPILHNRITSTVAGKIEPSVVFRILNADGSFKFIRGQSETIYDETGKAIRAIGTSQDITEIKKAEDENIKQRKFTENILNNLPADMVVFDANHNYVFINPVAIKDDEIRNWIIGKNDFDYCTYKGIDNAMAYNRRRFFEKVIQNKVDLEWVDEQITQSGKINYMLRKFHPLLENGEIEYVIGYGINITDLKESENQLKQTVGELNNKYNELMQFNYIVSHNLRAPVANILGLFNIMNLPDSSSEEKNKSLEFMHASIKKMDELIKDLSMILATRSSLNTKKEIVFIPQLIQSISSTLQAEISNSGTVIKLDMEEDAKELFSIKSYIESILYNLISNAIKYKAKDVKPKINIATKKSVKNLIVSVSDNGIGMDLNQYGDQLFGLYKRFNLEVEGKGLGLHMIKTQVETLGGTVAVESELGKGTTFVITLPMK